MNQSETKLTKHKKTESEFTFYITCMKLRIKLKTYHFMLDAILYRAGQRTRAHTILGFDIFQHDPWTVPTPAIIVVVVVVVDVVAVHLTAADVQCLCFLKMLSMCGRLLCSFSFLPSRYHMQLLNSVLSAERA